MSILGFVSFLGLFCNVVIIIVGLVAGLLKAEGPGSLREPATTYAFPQEWRALPLSFGLIMALWCGHSVYPNIYRDMRHPKKYPKGLNYIFPFVILVDVAMGSVGYLLYGNNILDEVSRNMIQTEGYSSAVKIIVLVSVAIVPVTKFPRKLIHGWRRFS